MCGITGIVYQDIGKRVDEHALISSRDTLHHRGPDEAGAFFEGQVGLAHRRLSIIDLSCGQQPMHSSDRNYCIVFNGEIYNYSEIRDHLIKKGISFRTKSDTEVILNLYINEGRSCVKRLKGMFAFAIWDKNKKELFCARDHLGKKPFFYHSNKTFFCFASEIKALFKYSLTEIAPELNSIDAYLTFGYVPGKYSAFKGIFKLPPAHSLLVRDGQVIIEKFWDIPDEYISNDIELSEERVRKEISDLFESSINERLMSEVPLGAFLSGGVDSTSVVAYMKRLAKSKIITTTIGFENRSFDESEIAKRSAEFYGTDHHQYIVSPDGLDIIKKLVYSFDEPFADTSSIPTYYVCQQARKVVTVALSGDGGDELFGGYTWYKTLLKKQRLMSRIGFLKGFISTAASFIHSPLKGSGLIKALGMDDWDTLLMIRSIFNKDLKHMTYSDNYLSHVKDNAILQNMNESYSKKVKDMDIVRKMQYFDLKYYLPDDILVKVDRMSMANSLEVRAPLLNYQMVELAWKLPTYLKIIKNQTKLIFKSAMKVNLPEEIFSYPKKGFSSPINHWLRTSMREFALDTLFSQKIKNRGLFNEKQIRVLWNIFEKQPFGYSDVSLQIWTLLMLEVWYSAYIDK